MRVVLSPAVIKVLCPCYVDSSDPDIMVAILGRFNCRDEAWIQKAGRATVVAPLTIKARSHTLGA